MIARDESMVFLFLEGWALVLYGYLLRASE
jgi:hypothetical protein